MGINASIAHRLLDILSVLVLTGIAYLGLKLTATKFDSTEEIAVVVMFLGAVANKLGFRFLHGKVK